MKTPWFPLSLGLAACAPAPEIVIEISDTPLARVSDRYLSFAIDSGQLVGGEFWNPDPSDPEAEIPIDPFPFDDPTLRRMTEALHPAMLRLGGTAADRIYYDLEGTVTEPPEGYSLVLTPEQWEAAAAFVTDLDLSLLFTLNAGAGPRDAGGAWDPGQALPLITDATARGLPIEAWELGNEVNGFLLLLGVSLDPEGYARDLATLRAALDTIDPGAKVAGPSSAYWPETGEFIGFADRLMDLAPPLDVVTWHYYPTQSERCPVATRPADPETMLQAATLDEVSIWAEEVEAGRDRGAPGAEVWLGESGNAQCGGQPGVSDRFAGGFWWLDQLGQLAARGQAHAVRQTLSGSDYGLLSDDGAFDPRPDYWTSVLWQRRMGPQVLPVSAGGGLRAYAHCDREGGVTVAVINPTDAPIRVGLSTEGPLEAWVLTADALSDLEVKLNGEPLPTTAGELPELAPEAVRRSLEWPARSYGYLRAPEARLSTCGG